MSKISDDLRECADTYDDKEFLPKINGRYHDIADRIDAEMAELPRGKDGKPIHVGETVYGEDGRAWHVEGITLGRWARYAEDHVVHTTGDSGQWRDLKPEWLTHIRPDSFKRIADELEAWCDDTDVDGDACDVPRGIADRIRKLAEKEKSGWQTETPDSRQ